MNTRNYHCLINGPNFIRICNGQGICVSVSGKFYVHVKEWHKATAFCSLYSRVQECSNVFFLSSLFLHHLDSNCKRMSQRFPLKDHVLLITWSQEEDG